MSPELALAAACCRWPPSPERDDAVKDAAARDVDWERFRRVVAHHRIAPLARDGLFRANVAMPPAVARAQSETAATAARRSLAMAGETIRLQRAFDAAGLPAIFVKGATLGMLAYGEVGMKQSWDIDLLTDPRCVLAARRVLLDLGYRAPAYLPDEARFARFVDLAIEAVFEHPELGMWVELHWRLVWISELLPDVGPQSPTQEVMIAGSPVRTLTDEKLFVYLCAHGAMHSWSRLKWIADLSAVLARRDKAEMAGLIAAGSRLGAARSVQTALIVRKRVLGLDAPAVLGRDIGSDRVASRLGGNALACIAYRGGAVEYSEYSVPWLRTVVGSFFLSPGPWYFFRTMRSFWFSAADRTKIMLPQGFAFLYHFLRIPLWLWRIATRAVGRPAL